MEDDAALATIAPSAPRRAIGLAVLCALGVMLIWIGFARPPAGLGWQLFLIATGAVALVLAERFWRATAVTLVLTDERLAESTGRELARVSDIRSVDRGMLAFKPSNGFLLRLDRPGPRGWAPGLWWRMGRSLGVGGVVHAAEAKAMAEALSVLIARRGD